MLMNVSKEVTTVQVKRTEDAIIQMEVLIVFVTLVMQGIAAEYVRVSEDIQQYFSKVMK